MKNSENTPFTGTWFILPPLSVGDGDFQRFHVGHGLRSFAGHAHHPGLVWANTQANEIHGALVAVLDPLLDQIAAQPSSNPSIQILQDTQRLYQAIVPYPSPKVFHQLLDDLRERPPSGSPRNLPNPALKPIQGFLADLDLQKFSRALIQR